MWAWIESSEPSSWFSGLFGSVSTQEREAHFPTLVPASAPRALSAPQRAYAALGRCDPQEAEQEGCDDPVVCAEAALLRGNAEAAAILLEHTDPPAGLRATLLVELGERGGEAE